MRQQLSRSNYVFSGLKTFHELNEAFPPLLDENGNRKTKERKRLKPLAKDLQSNPVLQSLLLCHKNTNLFLYIGKHQLRIYEIKPPSIMTATLTGGKLLSFFILLACIKKAPGSAHPLSRISGVRGLLSSARSQEHNRIANIRTISYTAKKHRPGHFTPSHVLSNSLRA